MEPTPDGRRFAADLVSSDEDKRKEAGRRLRWSPAAVTDPAAAYLAELIESGASNALRAVTGLVEQELKFGPAAHGRLVEALRGVSNPETNSALAEEAARALESFTSAGLDPNYKKLVVTKSRDQQLGRRVRSVFTRAWVLALSLVLLIYWFSMIFEPTFDGEVVLLRLIATGAFALFAIFVDALLRICPSCHKLLAGQLERIEADGSYTSVSTFQAGGTTHRVMEEVNTHKRFWTCVFCKHEWTS